MNYIVDFNEISEAGTAVISQFNDNYMSYDVSNSNVYWDNAKWGLGKTKSNDVQLCYKPKQKLVGKRFALKFYNNNPNEPFEIYGFDVLTKAIGRR
jgi:hypothetical protein